MNIRLAAALCVLLSVSAAESRADSYSRSPYSLSQRAAFETAFALAQGRSGGLREVAFTSSGQWMVIDDSTVATSSSFPTTARAYVNWYRYWGRDIDAVAVSPQGGVVVVAEDMFYVSPSGIWQRSRLYGQLAGLRDAGVEVHDVTFDPDGYGWVISAGLNTVAFSVDTALDEALEDAADGLRPVRQVAMSIDDGFAVVAGDWFHLHGLDSSLHLALSDWQLSEKSIDHVAFGPGGLQVAVSNGAWSRPWGLIDQLEGNLFGGQNIWERMDALGVPGVSIAIVDEGVVLASRSYGYRNAAERLPLTPRTPMDAASLSKSIAALGMLALVDDPYVDLDLDDDLVDDLLPMMDGSDQLNTYVQVMEAWGGRDPLPSGITPRRLLNHTAGFSHHGSYTDLASLGDHSLITLLFGFGCDPANQSCSYHTPVWLRDGVLPGTDFEYSGGGYLVAQGIIEAITGDAMEDVLADRVLGPIGMEDSTFDTSWISAYPDEISLHHDSNGDPVVGAERSTVQWLGAGGLYTTPRDMAKMLLTLANSGTSPDGEYVVTATSVDDMLSSSPVAVGQGLGMNRTQLDSKVVQGRPIAIEHGGAHHEFLSNGRSWGIRNRMRYRFAQAEGIVIMTNGGSQTLMDANGDGTLDPAAQILLEEIEDRFDFLWGWPANTEFEF